MACDGLSPAQPVRATVLYTEGISYLLEDDPGRAEPILARPSTPRPTPAPAPGRTDPRPAVRSGRPAQLLAGGDVAGPACGHDRAGRAFRRLLEQRPRLRLGGPGGAAPGKRLTGTVLPGTRRPAPAPAHLHAARSVSPGTAGDGAFLHHAGRPRGRRSGPDPSRTHPPAKARPRHPAQRAAELRAALATIKADAAGLSALTAAELRLLPLLPTHLSAPEIAAQMYLSPHTIRSQAMSIYRKLGATSRTQAVTRARELGLLEG